MNPHAGGLLFSSSRLLLSQPLTPESILSADVLQAICALSQRLRSVMHFVLVRPSLIVRGVSECEWKSPEHLCYLSLPLGWTNTRDSSSSTIEVVFESEHRADRRSPTILTLK